MTVFSITDTDLWVEGCAVLLAGLSGDGPRFAALRAAYPSTPLGEIAQHWDAIVRRADALTVASRPSPVDPGEFNAEAA